MVQCATVLVTDVSFLMGGRSSAEDVGRAAKIVILSSEFTGRHLLREVETLLKTWQR